MTNHNNITKNYNPNGNSPVNSRGKVRQSNMKGDTMVYHKRGFVEVDLPNTAHRGHMMHVKANEEIVACKYGVCTRVFRCKETCRLHEKFGRVANTIEEPANEVSGHPFNTLTT